MKKFLLTIFVTVSFGLVFGQQTIEDSIFHDGGYRTYTAYIPASYQTGTDVPLVFNLHGYTSNVAQQMLYGNMVPQSDASGFILVYPQGLEDGNGITHWNAGWGTGVDDLGFISDLIDTMSVEYSINEDRVFTCGMSNGGFMSYYLACQLSDKIAAMASVTGAMYVGFGNTCTSTEAVPVLEIHGTNDPTVPYNGNGTQSSIDDIIDFWVAKNNCNTTPVMTNVPNTNTGDGCTTEHYLYEGGTDNTTVELYKVIGGEHTWPGSALTIGVTSQDFDASHEIWRFFSQFDINGLLGVDEQTKGNLLEFTMAPNPTTETSTVFFTNELNALYTIQIIDLDGRVMSEIKTKGTSASLNTESLSSGSYIVHISTATSSNQTVLIKQ
jgi:polyhydroxybutyrate depolymerase